MNPLLCGVAVTPLPPIAAEEVVEVGDQVTAPRELLSTLYLNRTEAKVNVDCVKVLTLDVRAGAEALSVAEQRADGWERVARRRPGWGVVAGALGVGVAVGAAGVVVVATR